MDDREWRRYLGDFHDTRPGVTERLLGLAEEDPYAWLAEPLRSATGTVLDLACGSGPTRAALPRVRWAGVDSSAGELAYAAALGRGPLVMGDAAALPFATGSVDAVCAAMALQVLTPLDAVMDEVERVLRPDGVLAALTPAGLGAPPRGALAWVRVLFALRETRLSWPNPHACDGADRFLAARGWTVVSSSRRVLRLPMATPEQTALLLRGLYLPDTGPGRLRAAERSLAAWARPGRYLSLPLRRVVASPPRRVCGPSTRWKARAGE
ncbi:class I SAM-dependent methyltransferase [Nocardiopsis sp. YSL2]|uniref:class I SAM-dependent methyltransferase n=1 Tax=Nocardiopsis sp. YSL2 TaxID=2939492 RepID=UPI0026F422A1|nr:class I SAM-dependent methyltransferase [Nocardiopsis sp. YSL2]